MIVLPKYKNNEYTNCALYGAYYSFNIYPRPPQKYREFERATN